jgi:hypothetical protein
MLKYPEYLIAYTDGIAEIIHCHPAQTADLFGHICRILLTYPTTIERQQKLTRYVNIGGVQRLRNTTTVRTLLTDADYRATLLESLRPLSIGLVVQQELLADLFPE